MRITVDPHDHGELVNPYRQHIEIYLDGKKMDKVITADEEAGTVYRHRTDASGQIIVSLDRMRALTETLTGVVKVVIRPKSEKVH